ncbi:MAG: hypothetical protein BGO67_05600 [Alphaproteobacteria bacterium 41-28]|nr:MAG: hypothetical protein BGO67_05600 [Alphaproteobacteria bacterium 41-28]
MLKDLLLKISFLSFCGTLPLTAVYGMDEFNQDLYEAISKGKPLQPVFDKCTNSDIWVARATPAMIRKASESGFLDMTILQQLVQDDIALGSIGS